MTTRRRAHADLAFLNGSVLTMNGARPRASAVAIANGRIIAVGSDSDVGRLVGRRTRTLDLRGRTLLPSFQDAHIHPSSAGLKLMRCPLDGVAPVLDAYLETIADHAAAHPEKPWIIGSGWYMEAFAGGTPLRQDLDRAAPDRPAFFTDRDGHRAWLNSRALELAGLDRHTPDPPDGRIEREPDGTPQGTLHEGAVDLVARLQPVPTDDELHDAPRPTCTRSA
jgi:predicted amidohydrolase YtcJ